MFFKKCASRVREVSKKGTQGNKGPAMDLGERSGETAWGNVPELPIQLSWLWFVGCWTATMTRNPAINSKRRRQMWCTARSWLISLKKIVAWKHHTVWLCITNATQSRKNWMKSIWDGTHPDKWWMTLYMVRFHTIVCFLMPSSSNWDTIWKDFW